MAINNGGPTEPETKGLSKKEKKAADRAAKEASEAAAKAEREAAKAAKAEKKAAAKEAAKPGLMSKLRRAVSEEKLTSIPPAGAQLPADRDRPEAGSTEKAKNASESQPSQEQLQEGATQERRVVESTALDSTEQTTQVTGDPEKSSVTPPSGDPQEVPQLDAGAGAETSQPPTPTKTPTEDKKGKRFLAKLEQVGINTGLAAAGAAVAFFIACLVWPPLAPAIISVFGLGSVLTTLPLQIAGVVGLAAVLIATLVAVVGTAFSAGLVYLKKDEATASDPAPVADNAGEPTGSNPLSQLSAAPAGQAPTPAPAPDSEAASLPASRVDSEQSSQGDNPNGVFVASSTTAPVPAPGADATKEVQEQSTLTA
jgi:hypothetical protein